MSTTLNLLLLLLNVACQINFALVNGCPPVKIEGPAYPFQFKYFPITINRSQSYYQKLLSPERPLNSERLRVSPRLPEDWMGDHIIDQSVRSFYYG
jgi:fatty acid synthase, animal type